MIDRTRPPDPIRVFSRLVPTVLFAALPAALSVALVACSGSPSGDADLRLRDKPPGISVSGPNRAETGPEPDPAPVDREQAYLPKARLVQRPYFIDGPLALDPPTRRALARGRVDGRPATLVLSAQSGALLASVEPAGQIAVDAKRRRLHVDVSDRGLFSFDLDSLLLKSVVPLPRPDTEARELIFGTGGPIEVDPIVEPDSGAVLTFRDRDVHRVDPVSARRTDVSRPAFPASAGYIRSATLDHDRGWIYLTAYDETILAYHMGVRLLGYDLQSGEVLLEHSAWAGYDLMQAWGGHLWARVFAPKSRRFDTYLWSDGALIEHIHAWETYNRSPGYSPLRGAVIDPSHQLRYLLLGERAFAFDLTDGALRYAAEQPPDPAFDASLPTLDGMRLAVLEGQLVPVPSKDIKMPAPTSARAAGAPRWGPGRLFPLDEDRVYGLSGRANFDPVELLLTDDMGRSWFLPGAGLPHADRVTDLAISPSNAEDRILIAATRGSGIYRSTDGGWLWLPAPFGPDSRWIEELHISPDFASDGTVFAAGGTIAHYDPEREDGWGYPANTAWRSTDGGLTWQGMGRLTGLALSPRFADDERLWAFDIYSGEVLTSIDAGQSWTSVGELPFGQSAGDLMGVKLAAFSDPETQSPILLAFAADNLGVLTSHSYGGHGRLYRSMNGGRSWTLVLEDEHWPIYALETLLSPGGGRDLLLGVDQASWSPYVCRVYYTSRDLGESWTLVGQSRPCLGLARLPSGGLLLAAPSNRLEILPPESWPTRLREIVDRYLRFLPSVGRNTQPGASS